jgi:hypothetical protein
VGLNPDSSKAQPLCSINKYAHTCRNQQRTYAMRVVVPILNVQTMCVLAGERTSMLDCRVGFPRHTLPLQPGIMGNAFSSKHRSIGTQVRPTPGAPRYGDAFPHGEPDIHFTLGLVAQMERAVAS